jgi:hypothetical protein
VKAELAVTARHGDPALDFVESATGFLRVTLPPMREVHASRVKISRGLVRCKKHFCTFVGILAENPVGICGAKQFSEIRLTAGTIQVKFANCPRTKNNN